MMKVIFSTLRQIKNINNRYFTTSSNRNSYEGPGKTTIQFLSKHTSLHLIKNCHKSGFTLHSKIQIIGPMIIFPKTILYWDVESGADINRPSLTLFFTLDPKPDLVIIGLEKSYDFNFYTLIKSIFKEENIPVELLPVRRACEAFNFVCEEGRFVAAALIPPLEDSPPALLKAIQRGQEEIRKLENKHTSNKNVTNE